MRAAPRRGRRALLEQAFGRGAVQEYLSHRDNVGLLDLGRERLRKAVVIAKGFAPLRVIAEESQLLHVLAEAVYALDTRHMKVGRERVYHAYDLLDALSPEDPKAERLNDEWTDLGGVCAHSRTSAAPSASTRSKCPRKKSCQGATRASGSPEAAPRKRATCSSRAGTAGWPRC